MFCDERFKQQMDQWGQRHRKRACPIPSPNRSGGGCLLPANKTHTGVKSHSSKQGGTANYNEIMFIDEKGSELLRVYAEKDRDITVERLAKQESRGAPSHHDLDAAAQTGVQHRHRKTQRGKVKALRGRVS